jgi:hypothetical protein
MIQIKEDQYNPFIDVAKTHGWKIYKKNYGALYCCVRYLNLEHQDELFKTYHQNYCSKGNG